MQRRHHPRACSLENPEAAIQVGHCAAQLRSVVRAKRATLAAILSVGLCWTQRPFSPSSDAAVGAPGEFSSSAIRFAATVSRMGTVHNFKRSPANDGQFRGYQPKSASGASHAAAAKSRLRPWQRSLLAWSSLAMFATGVWAAGKLLGA